MARTAVREVAGVPTRLSWGAVFGGTFVALGVWVLLYSLGLALGLSAVDPQNPGSLRSAGIGTGIYLSRQYAEQVATQVEQQVNGVLSQAGGVVQNVQQGALTVVDRTGNVFWGVFIALFLGLISAVLGAMAGVTRSQRLRAHGAVAEEGVVGGAPTSRREVYP
jgi:carbon starvation protein CstA